ncbi:isopenicillin N synthase family dioxygenase [Komagataeibacter europaeus]|uniref:isopenicillin N synthase family dioxygenase n=1 Tax=Komagataeibacter europaeus TaxID=33995 RepID=UPI00030B47D0|nr:2-oxoglutarate and iron-dependent oxygenase domain-containing protein [Komagataeibacter europaeus]
MLHDLPVIDISPLRDGSSAARAAVAGAMGKACRETGFFYITGHGVTPDTMTKLFEASRSFFSQPAAAKDAISMKRVGKNRGYVGLGVERLDTTSLPDRKEAFNISPNEPDGVEAWPALPGWRDLMLEHFATCRDIGAALHRGFARDLGVDENFFVDKFRNPLATLRLLRYPAAPVPPRPPQGETGTTEPPGAGAHTDYGNVTILAVNGVSGLQVRPRGSDWIDAPLIPGTFICNIGDCLMRWSNDVYVSTPHRVLRPTAERYSIAFFLDPDADAIVEPIVSQPGETPHYPPVTGYEYLQERLRATYGHKAKT